MIRRVYNPRGAMTVQWGGGVHCTEQMFFLPCFNLRTGKNRMRGCIMIRTATWERLRWLWDMECDLTTPTLNTLWDINFFHSYLRMYLIIRKSTLHLPMWMPSEESWVPRSKVTLPCRSQRILYQSMYFVRRQVKGADKKSTKHR